ncbi:hypothetical protein [Paracoccus onubensis]|uniref:Uncharacterized protein n=1 Tax=Paracoccus onubensis TaxID=1675788 RepID=A0A418SS60_9RHOB|nr:hypothetical protein [Paracoccus onubensis]RJE83804.1 hypothetical protein D3P04_15580 [Paracoccus onubensis]
MTAGIGHNGGPSVASTSWRTHCWRRARADLLPVLPVEVVRTRVRRAQSLGLDYRTYAGVRATTGRDLVAFLFSSNALGVFRDGQPLDRGRAEKLDILPLDRHLGVGPGLDARALGQRIEAVSARPLPVFGSQWAAMRNEAKAWLHAQGLPGNAVLMIGETDHERELMAAGGLAGFITGTHYFTGENHAV